MLSENEIILWQGKPKKSTFIGGTILQAIPSFLYIILLVGGMCIWLVNSYNAPLLVIFGFILIGSFCLIKGIIELLTLKRRYSIAEYVLTNRRILIKYGFIGVDFQSINYKEITDVKLKVGIIDKLFKSGDIQIITTGEKNNIRNQILDIDNPYDIYTMIQKIIVNIQNDIEYPNKLRPSNNPGYNSTSDKKGE